MDGPKIDVLRFPQAVCRSFDQTKNLYFDDPSDCPSEFLQFFSIKKIMF